MPNPAGSLGSVFAPHILDTNEAKEKDCDSLRRDASGSWRLDAAELGYRQQPQEKRLS
jgi:hypothetical protein